MATGCGEAEKLEVEPPVTLVLGSAGGSGVVSAMLDEIFRYTSSTTPSGGRDRDGFSTSTAADHAVAIASNQSRRIARVTFSAVLVQGAKAVDLLSTTPGDSNGVAIKFDKASRQTALRGATWVDLQSTLDFERIVGLLLGRRTGMLEALNRYVYRLLGWVHWMNRDCGLWQRRQRHSERLQRLGDVGQRHGGCC